VGEAVTAVFSMHKPSASEYLVVGIDRRSAALWRIVLHPGASPRDQGELLVIQPYCARITFRKVKKMAPTSPLNRSGRNPTKQ
jgi:hypothetical protein